MSAIRCLETVRFGGITAGLARILTTLERAASIWAGQPDTIWITAGSDGHHSPNSRHYRFEAIDVRVKNFPSASAIERFRGLWTEFLADTAPGRFTLLLEDPNTGNQHFHCQVKKGTSFP